MYRFIRGPSIVGLRVFALIILSMGTPVSSTPGRQAHLRACPDAPSGPCASFRPRQFLIRGNTNVLLSVPIASGACQGLQSRVLHCTPRLDRPRRPGSPSLGTMVVLPARMPSRAFYNSCAATQAHRCAHSSRPYFQGSNLEQTCGERARSLVGR